MSGVHPRSTVRLMFRIINRETIRKDEATYAGYVQLYLGTTPGTRVAPWMRDLTTCSRALSDARPHWGTWSTGPSTGSYIERCVQHGTNASSHCAGYEVVQEFGLLSLHQDRMSVTEEIESSGG